MRMKENKIWRWGKRILSPLPLTIFANHRIFFIPQGSTKVPSVCPWQVDFDTEQTMFPLPCLARAHTKIKVQVKQLELHMKFTLHIKHSKPKHHTQNTKSRFHIKRCQMCDFLYLFLTNCLCLLGIFSVCTSGRLASASVWQLLVEVEFIFLSSTAPTSISHPCKRLRVIYHDTSCLHVR